MNFERSPMIEVSRGVRGIKKGERRKRMTNKEGWHVITRRPMTEEERKERKERSKKLGYDVGYEYVYIYGNLPEVEQEVIITTTEGYVTADCFFEDFEGIYFANHDVTEILAWMPMPEPYKPEGGQE